MPVSFEVYREGRRQLTFAPMHAAAVGPESVLIPGDVCFRDGLLEVSRADGTAVGVSLLWDVGPAGVFACETTRLPPRKRPYNLNVELARFRLMKIVQKQEDWNLFDFPRTERFGQEFAECQRLLAEALGRPDEPEAASVLADQSLGRSVALSEDLAAFHAELFLNRRRAGGAGKALVGCRADISVHNQRYRDLLAGGFDAVVLPMPWKLFSPQEGDFDTGPIDQWIELLSRKRTAIIAGPLINLVEEDLPDWTFIWENDSETLRELAYEHIQRVVARYRKQVTAWCVCGGLCMNDAFSLTFEQMIEMTRLLVAQVKSLAPQAKALVSVSEPFGEYHAQAAGSVSPILYAEMVGQAGVNLDGYALDLELGVPARSGAMRDLFQVGCLLDRFSTMGKPVYVTSLAAPGQQGPDAADRSRGKHNPALAGRWRRPWDAQVQADFLAAAFDIALSRPFVEAVAWADLSDLSPSVPAGGLYDDMFQAKPALERLNQIRERVRQWQTARKT